MPKKQFDQKSSNTNEMQLKEYEKWRVKNDKINFVNKTRPSMKIKKQARKKLKEFMVDEGGVVL